MSKEIPLSQGKVAIVDDEDYERVSQFKWCAMNTYGDKWYAARGIGKKAGQKNKTIYLHRFILDVPLVDHIDGDSLNCRRANLREVTPKQNSWNRKAWGDSGFKGVIYIGGGRWKAMINTEASRQLIGVFDSPEQAAHAYDAKAKEVYGAYAWLNFPNG
jgi:hypothetical protein